MNALNIHNTLAREKQTFSSLMPCNIRMYAGGMTMVFDVLYRWLKASNYDAFVKVGRHHRVAQA